MVFCILSNTLHCMYNCFQQFLNCVLKTIFENILNRFDGKLLSKGSIMWNSSSHEDFVLVEIFVHRIHVPSIPTKTTFKCEV